MVYKQHKNDTHTSTTSILFSKRQCSHSNEANIQAEYTLLHQREASYRQCTTGYQSPSLYLRLCCVNSNLGQTFTVEKNRIRQYIFCPMVLPNYCPSQGTCI